MNDTTKHGAAVASGVLGFITSASFAWSVYVTHTPQSVATWGMVLALDLLGLVLVYQDVDGNKKPYLQLGWTVAAFFIFSAVMLNGNQFKWGLIESLSVIFCGIAAVLWVTTTARKALWAYMAASYISFFPLLIDYWKKPQPDTLWLWLMTIVSCLLAILGAEKRNFEHLFIPWAIIGLNIVLASLCIR